MTLDDNILFLEKINEAAGDGRVLDAVLDEFAAAVRKGERDACLEIIIKTSLITNAVLQTRRRTSRRRCRRRRAGPGANA